MMEDLIARINEDLIATLSLIAAVLAAIFAALSWIAARWSALVAQKSAQFEAVRSALFDDYMSSEVRFAKEPPPDVKDRFRDARNDALKRDDLLALSSLEADQTKKEQNQWYKEIRDSKSFANAVSFELSVRLERLGAQVISGLVPLEAVLAVFGDVIVEDWWTCRHWVESYWSGADQSARTARFESSKADGVKYHRRHAEWLGLVAALWFHKRWKLIDGPPRHTQVLGAYGGRQAAAARLRKIWKADSGLRFRGLLRKVRRLTGVRLG